MGQILSHPLLCTTIMSLIWRMKILTGYGRCKMFEILNMTFSKFYSPSQYLAVNTVIVLFKGKVIFRRYIPKKHELLASKFINHMKRFDRHMIRQFILSLTGVRKFHIEILSIHPCEWYTGNDGTSWKDTNSTQQKLVCLSPWRWRSQNVTCELWVVGREMWQKYDVCVIRYVSDITTPRDNSRNSEAEISYANMRPETEM